MPIHKKRVLIIIIIVTFIGATNKIIWGNHKRRQSKVVTEHGTAEPLWWKSNFKQICFLTKAGFGFKRFNCNRELILECWRSYRESMFANIELSLGTKSCLEMDEILE